MTVLQKLFPPTANNDYRGSRIAFYCLCAFGVLFTGRSLIHYFKEDGGANSIASFITFPGNPDPDTLIYMLFAQWGGQQLITVTILGVVLWRYRSLIPFMFLMIIAEQLLRIGAGLLHPLTPDYFEHRPPGGVANLPLLLIAIIMLVLSLRQAPAKEDH